MIAEPPGLGMGGPSMPYTAKIRALHCPLIERRARFQKEEPGTWWQRRPASLRCTSCEVPVLCALVQFSLTLTLPKAQAVEAGFSLKKMCSALRI
jgi:hypothetical protein